MSNLKHGYYTKEAIAARAEEKAKHLLDGPITPSPGEVDESREHQLLSAWQDRKRRLAATSPTRAEQLRIEADWRAANPSQVGEFWQEYQPASSQLASSAELASPSVVEWDCD